MDLKYYKEQTIENVITPMIEFMEEWDDCDYTREDVQRCHERIDSYLEALDAMSEPDDEAIMEQVRELILDLNELNDAAGYSLIETDAREEICEIIQNSAIDRGLQHYSDDITEEWREW